MITLQQAKMLQRGDILVTPTGKRWKVNGKVQRWIRDQDRIRVPLKFGLYTFGALDNSDFNRNGECNLLTLQSKLAVTLAPKACQNEPTIQTNPKPFVKAVHHGWPLLAAVVIAASISACAAGKGDYLPGYYGDGVPSQADIDQCQNWTSLSTAREVIYDPKTDRWSCEDK